MKKDVFVELNDLVSTNYDAARLTFAELANCDEDWLPCWACEHCDSYDCVHFGSPRDGCSGGFGELSSDVLQHMLLNASQEKLQAILVVVKKNI